MTLIIGLTGGIGSGKTVISDHFATLGAPIIDTDVTARTIVKPGQTTLTELSNAFGKTILYPDGSLNRQALRKIAFASNANKKILDAITHPVIRRHTQQQIQAVRYPYCILVVPLLIESIAQFKPIINRILVVTAPQQTRIDRVKQRNKLSDDEIKRIMRSQIDDKQRLKYADDIINNNGSIEQVHQQVEQRHHYYLSTAP